jgi:hypothetical protein
MLKLVHVGSRATERRPMTQVTPPDRAERDGH